jgi:hypothetical protein
MDVWVIFQSPTGQQHQIQVTERSSEEATMQAAAKLLDTVWEGVKDWFPVCIVH